MKIAINGFGRIGRCVARALADREDLELIAINTLGPEDIANYCAYVLKYDSVHGEFPGDISVDNNVINFGGQRVKITSFAKPCDWHDVDLVMECTGAFTTRARANLHLDAGAKYVLVSAPGAKLDATVVYGINHQCLSKDTKLISNASCTTNALAPVVQVLDDLAEIDHGLMNTIHAVTGDQSLIDNMHKDWRRGRAAMSSMIPTNTGAAKAISEVLPNLAGKLDGFAVRVPTNNVSLVDLTVTLKREVSVAEVNAAMANAAAGSLAGVLKVTDQPLVSIDILGNTASAVFDLSQTRAISNMYKCLIWYDNEIGFANRMLDTAKTMKAFV